MAPSPSTPAMTPVASPMQRFSQMLVRSTQERNTGGGLSARRHPDRPPVGELPVRGYLPELLAHRTVHRHRRSRHRTRSRALGERRSDGPVLLRRRPRGQARVRDGRADRPLPSRYSHHRSARRAGTSCTAVPTVEPVRRGCGRLGRRHLHRHWRSSPSSTPTISTSQRCCSRSSDWLRSRCCVTSRCGGESDTSS
jgi:hypothetical protein